MSVTDTAAVSSVTGPSRYGTFGAEAHTDIKEQENPDIQYIGQ